MANMLDELSEETREEGLETKVIAKKIPVTVGVGSKIFEILLWIPIIPGLIFLIMKIKAGNYFQQLEQRIQHNASTIDNYLENRVRELENVAALLNKHLEHEKGIYENIAKYRSGNTGGDEGRNEMASNVENISRDINVALENYPDLKAQQTIITAMQKNARLQSEITAAREVYNNTVNTWNREIFSWPTKQIVAAKKGYTTRIPFIASAETKEKAKAVFF